MAERIVLTNMQSPGDVIVLTAAVRDVCLAYPGRFEFMVHTSTPDAWANNPFVGKFTTNVLGLKQVKANYPLIHRSNQEPSRPHFIWGFLEDLNRKLNVDAPLTELRPALYLTSEEKRTPPIAQPYWVMVGGGKKDFTAKWWVPDRWQQVIDRLKDRRTIVQVGSGGHVHPRLKNVHDLVGKTTMRDLFRLIYHAEGVMCIVTCLMHIAAAFNKPTVIVAGGREPWWWEAYTNQTRKMALNRGRQVWTPVDDGYVDQQYLHTMNKLSCCREKGCWKSHVGPGLHNPCLRQVTVPGIQHIPECLTMITADDVVRAVESYFPGGLVKDTPALKTAAYEPPQPNWKAVGVRIDPNKVQVAIPASPVSEWEKEKPQIVFCAGDKEPSVLKELKSGVPDGASWTVYVASKTIIWEKFCIDNKMTLKVGTVETAWTESVVGGDHGWLIWLGPGLEPYCREWFAKLHRATTDSDAVGWFSWEEQPASIVEQIKTKPWYKSKPLGASKEGTIRVIYPQRGFLAVRRETLKKMGAVPEEGIEFGLALDQVGARLGNAPALFVT